ncbi:MAG: hypothetical protein HYY37_03845 [Candidatus Aenigmarchaeota archaeon]|nr:hypothetical protein [Candidatus Aenigmarchaeota archaeon]
MEDEKMFNEVKENNMMISGSLLSGDPLDTYSGALFSIVIHHYHGKEKV